MQRGITRRGLLRGAGAALAVSWTGVGTVLGRGQAETDAFDPATHGYGFPNWSTRAREFEPPPDPSREAIRERIRTQWRGQARALLGVDTARLATALVDALAAEIRVAVVQRAGTNGHCYGMSLTAQQYFREPATIPVDRSVASEIDDPRIPLEEPTAPVYEAIVQAQAAQYLRFRAWLGRRAMLTPDRIDLGRVVDDVRAVVEDLGTATLTLFDGSLYSHQVLAYAVEDRGDRVVVPVYDPNRSSADYRDETRSVTLRRRDGTLAMEPYGQYVGLLFNRHDQIEAATDRDRATPLDHVTVDRGTLRESLFPVAVVLVDAPTVDVTVVDPTGRPVGRVRGRYMDRTRGRYAHVRTRFGADPGTYRIRVFGSAAADYELRATVGGVDGVAVETTRSASIAAGEVHTYELTVPGAGEGTVDRVEDGNGSPDLAVVGAGALGGLAAGAAGYRALASRRDGD